MHQHRQQQGPRIKELDVLRAFLIFFVVFGHSQCCLDQSPVLRELIYSFHMPAMFTLSGLVAALSWKCLNRGISECLNDGDSNIRGFKHSNILRKLVRSAKRLLLPYLLCGLLLTPAWCVWLNGGGFAVFKQAWADCLLHNRGLWYLPCCYFLVSSYVLVATVRDWFSGRKVDWLKRPIVSWSLSCLAVFLTFAAGYYLTRCDFLRSVLSYWFSFYAGVALAYSPFLSTLLRFKSSADSNIQTFKHSNIPPLVPSSSLPSSFLLPLVMFLIWIGLASVFVRQPHTLVGNLIKPFAGLAAMFPLAWIAHFGKRIPGLARVGESTLAIYCVEGIVGWKFFTVVAPGNVFGAIGWSLALVLAVHVGRVVIRARYERGTRK